MLQTWHGIGEHLSGPPHAALGYAMGEVIERSSMGVSPEVHLQFLTIEKGYLSYVEYWNDKLKASKCSAVKAVYLATPLWAGAIVLGIRFVVKRKFSISLHYFEPNFCIIFIYTLSCSKQDVKAS